MTATRQHTGNADYTAREVSRGLHAYHLAASRKQGPDAKEQAADLISDTRTDRARWVMEGSYGSEYAHAVQAQLFSALDHARTPLQIERAYRNAGTTAHTIAALMDYDSLNARSITTAYKRAGYDKQQFDQLTAELAQIARDYYTDEV